MGLWKASGLLVSGQRYSSIAVYRYQSSAALGSSLEGSHNRARTKMAFIAAQLTQSFAPQFPRSFSCFSDQTDEVGLVPAALVACRSRPCDAPTPGTLDHLASPLVTPHSSLKVLHQHQISAELIDLRVQDPSPIRGGRKSRNYWLVSHSDLPGLPRGKVKKLNCRTHRAFSEATKIDALLY
jgi:hypothetical protein